MGKESKSENCEYSAVVQHLVVMMDSEDMPSLLVRLYETPTLSLSRINTPCKRSLAVLF